MYKSVNVTSTWRNQLAKIKAAKKEYAEYFSIMSQYERTVNERRIAELTRENFNIIRDGVLNEHNSALNLLKYHHEKVKSEKQKEIASWDAQKLAAEMQVYTMLIDQAFKTIEGSSDFRKSAADRLENIISEAEQSGDKYKKRAAFEMVQSATGKVQGLEDRRDINRITQDAKVKLEKVRSTLELEKAYEFAESAWAEYLTTRQEVIKTSQDIGEGDPAHPLGIGPFTEAIRRVQIINNEIKIYEPGAPEIREYTPDHPRMIKQR